MVFRGTDLVEFVRLGFEDHIVDDCLLSSDLRLFLPTKVTRDGVDEHGCRIKEAGGDHRVLHSMRDNLGLVFSPRLEDFAHILQGLHLRLKERVADTEERIDRPTILPEIDGRDRLSVGLRRLRQRKHAFEEGGAIERTTRWTWKATLSLLRRMKSASTLSNGDGADFGGAWLADSCGLWSLD